MAEPAITIEGLDELKAVSDYRYLFVTPTKKFMKATGAALRQAAARVSPKGRTKKYSRSWVEVYGPGDIPESVTVRNTDEPKATWIAFGTRAHIIRPRNAAALMWEGAAHPYALVHHPGTKPNDVTGKTLIEAKPEIDGPLTAAWEAELEARWNRKSG